MAPPSDRRCGRCGDSGYVVVGSLARMTLAVAIIGTAGYDAISMTSMHLQVQDHAQQAAAIGYDALAQKHTTKAVYAAVLRYAEEVGDTVVPSGISISKDKTVTVTLTNEAHTIAASHIPGAKDYVVATGTGSAGDPIR